MSYPKQPGSGTEQGYNGWKNYETWNVALWIGNDEGLYGLAQYCSMKERPYAAFVELLTFNGMVKTTPDGVSWNDSKLDIDALDEMMGEL